jgi:hypothetical protein
VQKKLISLADYLDECDLENEAGVVDAMIEKLAQQAPQGQETFVNQMNPIVRILRFIGLDPGPNNGVDFVNSALYLGEGVNKRNLLLSALSVTSLVPELRDVMKIVDGTADETETYELSKKILEKKELIRSIFSRLKNERVARAVSKFVLKGDLLLKYADMAFETMRKWALETVSTHQESETDPEAEEAAEELVDEQLQDLEQQL